MESTKKNIVVTGGLGFIGSNLVKQITESNQINQIYVIDKITSQNNSKNLNYIHDKRISYIPYETYHNEREIIDLLGEVHFIFHLGAIASTDPQISKIEIENANYKDVQNFLKIAHDFRIQMIVASSFAVYGNQPFVHNNYSPKPINNYGESKHQLENFLMKLDSPNFVALRFTNVFGDGESHKKNMASLPYNMFSEAKHTNNINCFYVEEDGVKKFANRDFILVNDLVLVLIEMMNCDEIYGANIFDLGSGKSLDTREMAKLVKDSLPDLDIQIREVPAPSSTGYQLYSNAKMDVFDLYKTLTRPTDPTESIKKYLFNLANSFKLEN